MADGINLPSNLYTAGAVPIDIQQGQGFAAQLALKNQARQDALNEYYQNINKTINPEGIRPQETSGFLSKYNDFNNFYSQNRQAIQNPRLDGGKAQAEFNSRHLDLMADADRSKQEQNAELELWKARSNPATAYMFNSPDILNAIQRSKLSIYDPNFKPLNVDELQSNAQPLGVKDLNTLHAGLLKDMKMVPIGKPEPDELGNAYQPVGFDQPTKQAYLARAQTYYNSDPKIRTYAAGIVNDPNRYTQARNSFLNITGREPNNEAELFAGDRAAADNLDQIQKNKVTDTQTRSNITQAREIAVGGINDIRAQNRMKLGSDLTLNRSRQLQQDDYDRLENQYNNIVSAATTNQGKNITDSDGKKVTEYSIPVINTMNKAFHRGTVGGQDYDEPIDFRSPADGKYVRVVYPDGSSKKIPKSVFLIDFANAAPSMKKSTPEVASPPPVTSTPGSPQSKPASKFDVDAAIKKYGGN